MLPGPSVLRLESGQQAESHPERLAKGPTADASGLPCARDLLEAQRPFHVIALVRSNDAELESAARRIDVGVGALERGQERLDALLVAGGALEKASDMAE